MPYPVAAIRNRNFGGVATPFVGAYDAIPNIVAAYGMRRLRSAYTGSILRIRESGGNTELDIGALANGDLDTAAAMAHIGGGSGYIVKWYDQSDNAYDASQTTAASQPLYVASGQNGRPVGRWDGVNDRLELPTMSAGSNCTFLAIYKSFFGNGLFDSAPFTANALRNLSGNFEWMTNDPLIPANATNLFLMLSLIFSLSPARKIQKWENGGSFVEANSANTVPAGWGTPRIGTVNNVVSPLNGDIAELIICNAALSDANRQAAEAAGNNYWAVF